MSRPQAAPIVARLVAAAVDVLSKPLGARARVFAKALLMERLNPVWVNKTKFGSIAFYCPATWPYSRSDMAKEPHTTQWIEGFADGDVFWDIGANVGVFSLLAAKKGHRVVAFEPAAVNYFVLVRNVELNAFDERITFLNIALSDVSRLDILYMPHTAIGGAQHTFAAPGLEGGVTQGFKQACIGYSVDDLLNAYELPFPNHMKIDVDGIEDRIVSGAKQTLRDPRLKSVLVEVNSDAARELIYRELGAAGFEWVKPARGDGSRGNQLFRRRV